MGEERHHTAEVSSAQLHCFAELYTSNNSHFNIKMIHKLTSEMFFFMRQPIYLPLSNKA